MWKFQYQKDDGNAAHAWDYYTLFWRDDIPHSVGYCILLLIGSFHNLSSGKCNSSHVLNQNPSYKTLIINTNILQNWCIDTVMFPSINIWDNFFPNALLGLIYKETAIYRFWHCELPFHHDYVHNGWEAQLLGNPMAVTSTDGYVAINVFSFVLKASLRPIESSQ